MEWRAAAYTINLRVFICHATEDKPRLRELRRRLKKDGFETWIDDERLLPGQDWELEIGAAVRSSDAVVVCLSVASVGKIGYVQKELRLVLDAAEYQPEGRIFVIPVRLELCSIPPRLARLQFADLFVDEGYERLIAALRARSEGAVGALGNVPPARVDTQFVRPRPRRWWMLAVMAGLAALGGGFAFFRYTPGPQLTSQTVTHAREPVGMLLIPNGRFLMGRNDRSDPDAAPAHEVTLPAFYIDRTPVTNASFKGSGEDRMPVTGISWDEAAAYCLAGGKRLPTEAEWEFAARGADGRLYPWGENFETGAANTREGGIGRPEAVGTRLRNVSASGVADMSGNVWQWCADDYRAYPGGTVTSPIPRGAKVIRGGSYQSDRFHATTVTRNLELPSTRSAAIGFRCAK